MNYLELIKNFWIKDGEMGFTEKEIAFYFYLLRVCNSQGWKNPFGLSNAVTAAKFGWGRHSFNNVKNKLKQAGLIDFEARRGRGNIYQYELLIPNRMTESKLSRTKELDLPHTSPAFEDIWNKLLQTPKWRGKSKGILQVALDCLKEFDEAFAILQIEQCIIGDWQGIIYKDTDSNYRKWKMEQSKTYESPTDRKTEIVRRASEAIAACNS